MTLTGKMSRAIIDAAKPFVSEHAPTFTLDRQVQEARQSMGETRWQELMADWDRGYL